MASQYVFLIENVAKGALTNDHNSETVTCSILYRSTKGLWTDQKPESTVIIIDIRLSALVSF